MAIAKAIVPMLDIDKEIAKTIAKFPDDGDGIGGFTITTPTAMTDTLRVSASQIRAFVKVMESIQATMMGMGEDDE